MSDVVTHETWRILDPEGFSKVVASEPQKTQEQFKNIPVAVAIPIEDGERLRVLWCPYCKERHQHTPGYGTRVAHCMSGEYVLVPPRGTCVWGYLG